MRQHGIVAHESYQSISRDSLVRMPPVAGRSVVARPAIIEIDSPYLHREGHLTGGLPDPVPETSHQLQELGIRIEPTFQGAGRPSSE
jgi:hypothetical protein